MTKDNQTLRWACRRGMLELDLLLSSFIKNHYHLLSEVEKTYFYQLLDCEDQTLFGYFFANIIPDNEALKTIVTIILTRVR